MLSEVVIVLLSYLSGSISSAILLARAAGLPDPRTCGSKNPGATNMLRLGDRKYAALTLFIDMLKGFIPVIIAKMIGVAPLTAGMVMLTAFLGHLFPLFFNFKGGKGVATGFGVVVASNWLLGLSGLLVWLAAAAIFRYSSLAALIAFAVIPPAYLLTTGADAVFAALVVISLLIFGKHHENIRNLIKGRENKLGSKAL